MAAFLVTAVSSLGLYFAVALGPILAVWLIMACVAAAMILAVCVSQLPAARIASVFLLRRFVNPQIRLAH